MIPADNKITTAQLELLKSFKYLTSDQQIGEVKSLLHHYYRARLDAAIDDVEMANGFTEEVYESWLRQQRKAA